MKGIKKPRVQKCIIKTNAEFEDYKNNFNASKPANKIKV